VAAVIEPNEIRGQVSRYSCAGVIEI